MGYQVHGTERKISHLLYMDDLKLLCRNENELKNEMKIVQTIIIIIIIIIPPNSIKRSNYVTNRNYVTKIRPMRVASLCADRQSEMMMITLRKYAQGHKNEGF